VWGSENVAPPFLISALDVGELLASRPGLFTPVERAPGNHWVGGWVASRTGLDAVEWRNIFFLCRELNPGLPTRSRSLYRLSCPVLHHFVNAGTFTPQHIIENLMLNLSYNTIYLLHCSRTYQITKPNSIYFSKQNSVYLHDPTRAIFPMLPITTRKHQSG
jgi:hypothetical protein